MKFACEQCKTKYSIADERVRGKVLKIRCKNCGHVMTVREESLPRGKEKGVLERAMEQALEEPPSSSFQGSDATIVGSPDIVMSGIAALAPPALDLEEWHISVDGVPKGPLKLEALAQRIIVERAAGDQEIFVWRDGFDDWQPPREVPEVRVAVERLRPGLPANFWGAPAPLFKAAPRNEIRSTHPVERIESFEFTDTPPTISVPRKTTAALAKELQRAGEGRPASAPPPRAPGMNLKGAPEPRRPLSAARPSSDEPRRPGGSGPPALPPPLPGPGALPPAPSAASAPTAGALSGASGPSALPPAPTPPSSQGGGAAKVEGLSEVLAQLDDDDVLPTDAAGPGVELNISEPSQMIDLRALAGVVPAPVSDVVLPGLEVPPPAAPPSVLVMAGPAPAATGRQMKVVLAAAISACVLLMGLVAWLLLHRPAGPAGTAQTDKPGTGGEGKAVTDRPVLVQDAPQPGATPGDAVRKQGAAAKKPLKLPAAAAGKTQLNSNAEALARLYEGSGGDKGPSLPANNGAAQGGGGGGVSTAELLDVMRRNQKSLSPCYERVLKHDESLRRARIDVQLKVGQTGTVTHVTISAPYGGTDLGTCMQQTIRRWHFPPSDSDYETQFPLVLTAN